MTELDSCRRPLRLRSRPWFAGSKPELELEPTVVVAAAAAVARAQLSWVELDLLVADMVALAVAGLGQHSARLSMRHVRSDRPSLAHYEICP